MKGSISLVLLGLRDDILLGIQKRHHDRLYVSGLQKTRRSGETGP